MEKRDSDGSTEPCEQMSVFVHVRSGIFEKVSS